MSKTRVAVAEPSNNSGRKMLFAIGLIFTLFCAFGPDDFNVPFFGDMAEWEPKTWKCNECGHIWDASAPMVNGCPNCNSDDIDVHIITD